MPAPLQPAVSSGYDVRVRSGEREREYSHFDVSRLYKNHRHTHAHTHFTLSKSFTHSFTHTHTHTHTGPCPPCQGERNVTCPCSRNATVAVPCGKRSKEAKEEGGGGGGGGGERSKDSAAEGTCGGVCGKLLHCGEHYCTRRCHFGTCAPCRVEVCWLLVCVLVCFVNCWTVESIAVRVGVPLCFGACGACRILVC